MREVFLTLILATGLCKAQAQTSTASASLPTATSTASLPSESKGSKEKELKWSGDLRLRGQMENNDNNDSRISQKIRLRASVKAQLDEQLRAEIRLLTGQSARSGNQTLGDNADPGMTRRFFGIDLAYAEWSPLSFFKLDAGRIPQVHYRPGGSQLILDEDIALEGTAIQINQPLFGSWSFFGNAGSVLIRENYDSFYSENLTDNAINWAQLGLGVQGEKAWVKFGAGFFNFAGMQGSKFADLMVNGKPNGNSEDGTGIVKNNFVPRDIFIDSGFKSGPWDWGLFVERVINDETHDPNRAWWIGGSLARGNWDGQIAYQETQSDSVPAIFTWDDFGAGTTDSRGIVLSARWKFTRNMNLKATQFFNRLRYSTDNAQYIRSHLDLSMTF